MAVVGIPIEVVNNLVAKVDTRKNSAAVGRNSGEIAEAIPKGRSEDRLRWVGEAVEVDYIGVGFAEADCS